MGKERCREKDKRRNRRTIKDRGSDREGKRGREKERKIMREIK